MWEWKEVRGQSVQRRPRPHLYSAGLVSWCQNLPRRLSVSSLPIIFSCFQGKVEVSLFLCGDQRKNMFFCCCCGGRHQTGDCVCPFPPRSALLWRPDSASLQASSDGDACSLEAYTAGSPLSASQLSHGHENSSSFTKWYRSWGKEAVISLTSELVMWLVSLRLSAGKSIEVYSPNSRGCSKQSGG